MKLSQLKNRYRACQENKVFTTRTMWNLIKEVESKPCEIYWDYRDELSKEDIDTIESKGLEGLYEIEEQIRDLNLEYMDDMEMQQRIDVIPSSSVCYSVCYRESYLEDVLREYQADVDSEATIDDVMELTYNDLYDLDCGFCDAMDLLKEYQSVDINMKDLFSNTTYERALWHEILSREIEDYFPQEIKDMEEEGYEYKEPGKDFYIKITYPQDSIEEIANFFTNFNKPYASIETSFDAVLLFENEDGEEKEVECSTELTLSASDFTIEDADERQNSDWDEIIERDLSDVTFWYPSDEMIEEHNTRFEDAPKIGESDINSAKVLYILDNSFYIVEAEKSMFFDGGLYMYSVFGFNKESRLWEDRAVKFKSSLKKPQHEIYLDSQGSIIKEEALAS